MARGVGAPGSVDHLLQACAVARAGAHAIEGLLLLLQPGVVTGCRSAPFVEAALSRTPARPPAAVLGIGPHGPPIAGGGAAAAAIPSAIRALWDRRGVPAWRGGGHTASLRSLLRQLLCRGRRRNHYPRRQCAAAGLARHQLLHASGGTSAGERRGASRGARGRRRTIRRGSGTAAGGAVALKLLAEHLQARLHPNRHLSQRLADAAQRCAREGPLHLQDL
mmetsp:Transcript_124755/g.278812  ORF Transcript_124755/g.278812 Transcript_124755/m.278812 type:complete len:221 (-) Transcript_124755:132-794(-)